MTNSKILGYLGREGTPVITQGLVTVGIPTRNEGKQRNEEMQLVAQLLFPTISCV